VLSRTETIGVIGGGASGALTAIHALRGASGRVRVVIIEPRELLGRGVAYGTTDPRHLLNVRAGCLSAFPDEPGHFTAWARRTGPVGEASYLPRLRYGEYLQDLLPDVEHLRGEALRLRPTTGGAVIEVSGGKSVSVDRVVLAAGASPRPMPDRLAHLGGGRGVVADPWSGAGFDQVPTHLPVLLIGTGLTAVDVALSLRGRGHRRIFATSRHGLFPAAHVADQAAAVLEPPRVDTARSLLRWMRATAEGQEDWRAAVDGFRPHTDQVWGRLPPVEQERLIRLAGRHWEVRRHRMAPAVARSVDVMRQAGELTLVSGALTDARPLRDGYEVTVGERRLRVGGIVNCTGVETDVSRSGAPLVRGLLDQGLARPSPLRLGLETTLDGRLPECGGRVWVIGPLRRGRVWETTAIPDIRAQAAAIATGARPRTLMAASA
jgi:uncharacterized NAD(P)/FAD-binding protein YdhS